MKTNNPEGDGELFSRAVCVAIVLQSPRSGLVIFKKLIKRGFVYRDPDGQLQLSEPVRDATRTSGNLPPTTRNKVYSISGISLS
jgi:hypothetical protein